MKTKTIIALFLIGICLNAHAYDFSAVAPSGQTLYYTISGNNVTVASYPHVVGALWIYGDLTIPENVTNNGITYTVTAIGIRAFEDQRGLTSVTFPNTITSIDGMAFADCGGLTAVIFPDTNTSISIGSHAFSGCNSLTSVTFPSSITTIGNHSFYGCNNLSYIAFSNNLISIGNAAFANCGGLTSVTIPSSVSTIGAAAFQGCNMLDTFNYYAINCTMNDPIFYSTYNQHNPTVINIGDSVITIPGYFLYGCSNISSLSIPISVSRIGSYAFKDCSGLTSITFPSSLITIGQRAFENCTGLSSLTIPSSVDSINGNAFKGCTGLITINLPNFMEYIGSSAFYGCSSLTSIILPNSITRMYYGTFTNCSSLASITMGNSVATIDQNAFYGCSGLTEIRCLATTAPTISDANAFSGVPNSIIVKIPCGSQASYYSLWGDYFSNFTESASMLNANSLDTTMGFVTILSQPTCQNSTATAFASANSGYHFLQWSNGITANPYTLTLLSDSTITAEFAHNQHNVLVQSSNGNIGSVDGSGTYNEFDTITLVAYPIEHYHFVRWSDGNTDNPRQYIVTGDATLTAYFAIDTHSVSVVSNDIARGMVNSTGTEFVYGTPCTVTATAYTGFEFIRWSNGVTANPYTFAVLGDVELTAIFVAPGEETYTVTVSVNDPTMGTATVNGNASASVTSGTEVTLTATSNEGYRFVRWNDNNTNAVRTITVTSDMSFTATFEAMGSTEGIDEADGQTVVVYAAEGSIHIDAAQPAEASIYDMMGHRLATVTTGTSTPLPAGVYLVKVGTQPARKVVVIR